MLVIQVLLQPLLALVFIKTKLQIIEKLTKFKHIPLHFRTLFETILVRSALDTLQ